MKYAVAASALMFLLLGWILIPFTGIQTDEALFALPYYVAPDSNLSVSVFGHPIPLMVFPYIGTLKTLLCWPVQKMFAANAYSFRFPMVVVGAAAILVFFKLSKRIVAPAAALIATLLFATDPSFLINVVPDRGPIAIQIFLTILGGWCFVSRRPAWGSFCFGLALWNKAIFAWSLAGLAAAALAVLLPEIRQHLADRRVLLRCAAGFLLGILPLVIFNLHTSNATFAATRIGVENLPARLISLQTTLDGSILFGYISAAESLGSPKAPRTLAGRIATRIRETLGTHYSSLFFYAVVLGLLATPWWWNSPGRRVALFTIIACTVTFCIMTVIRYTGWTHHVVLLWPLPQLFVGVVIALIRPKWLMIAAATAAVGANLLVDNQWVAELERNGSYRDYTDAVYSASDTLSNFASEPIYVADTSIYECLILLHEGRLDLRPLVSTLHAGPAEDGAILAAFADPRGVFLTHVPERIIHTETNERLARLASTAGYEKQVFQVITDVNGRPNFELYRYVR